MTSIVAFLLLCIQLGAQAYDFLLTKKPIEINTSSFATNSDLPIQIINNLLEQCSNKTLEECDLCALCQNEAFCYQQSKKPSLMTSTKRLMTTADQISYSPHQSLAYLRSQKDFTCYCVPGYTGTYCQIDINECLSSPCSNNATCIDLINAYECRCPSGYTGENCEIDINECDSSPCDPQGGHCNDLIDGYYCDCNPGFTGPTCSININECASQPCMNNATCIDLINGFACNCNNTGFDGLLCENNIDDCLNVDCQHGSVCIDGINSFKCDCYPGYDGKFCEIDIDECLSSPCVYGKCWQNSDRQSLARKYLLSNSSTSLENLNEQIFEISLKIKFNYSNSDGYWCECQPGYTGTYCEMKIDECQSSPCGPNGKCIDLINGYKCDCYPGFTGTTCTENINECELYSPCAENTICIDLVPDYSDLSRASFVSDKFNSNRYYCDCTNLNNQLYKKNGNRDVIYAGQNCTLKLNACQSLKTKCQHGSECQSILFNSTEQDIMCLCKPGYTGKYCEYSTVFRMDGTYFVQQQIDALNDSLSVQFEFRINFFDREKFPLIYFDHFGKLLYQIELYRDHLEIKNEIFGLNSKIGFLYQESDESYFSLWNFLQIRINKDFLIITYSIKQIQLNVTKIIDLKKHSELSVLRPTNFFLGKDFHSLPGSYFGLDQKLGQEFTTNSLLSDACFRDFNLNMDIIFKSLKPDYLNYGFDSNNRVKFGCNLRSHGLLNEYQCRNEAKAYRDEGNYCENNSTCVNRWFNYECKKCSLPFYGKNCNYESNRLVFANQYDKTSRHNEAYLDIDFSGLSSQLEEKTYFQIEFNLHRFTQRNQNLGSFMNFLTLKQKKTSPLVQNFYQLGINQDGYLTLQKIQLNRDQSQNETFRLIWSLRNEKISLNQFNTSFTSLLNLKFNDQFVQLDVNQTNPVRFKLSPNLRMYSDQIEKFEITNIIFMSNFSVGHNFLIQDLVVNQMSYQFRLIEPFRAELVLLNNKNEFILKTMNLFKMKNVALIKKTQFENELDLIDNLQCPSGQSVTDISKNFSKKKCFESLSIRFRDNLKLSNFIKVNCELKPYTSGPTNNQQYYSTCENYGVIKRRLSNKSKNSYITYFFDFDPESQESLKAKFGPLLTPNETLALINVSKQRRIALLQDIDFYSLSFDLSLGQKLQGSIATKTNLFTLNSLDDLTSNKIFLFGVNLYINNKQGLSEYEFEIFTGKQSIKTQALKLPDLVNVNLTFTFDSIELRLNHNSTYQIRLTDKYFDLFIRLLLKAYGSFQLNIKREEELSTKSQSYLSSCISNIKLLTRKSNEKVIFNYYDLIGQTKSIIISKQGPSFDSLCDSKPLNKKNEGLDFDLVPENCYLVTEFDVIGNRHVKDVLDCECDTVKGDCSYNFWSGFEQRNRITNGKELEFEEFHGCAETNEYACFNNGTCVDNYYADSANKRESYRCLCTDSYTGKRCERFDPCLRSSCSINSTCEPKLMDNNQIGYECKCFPGFLGRNCNIKVDQTCLGKPCLNGATCINITSFDEENLSYECMCPLGYEGKRCDKKIDYCYLYQPCKNGAVCSNSETVGRDFYECRCSQGWKGINCTQDIDECADMDNQNIGQCSGNGYCINIPGSYKCKCSDLYFGKNCEQVHICQGTELPCQNGGICIVAGNVEENRYSCRCPIGYAGINCSFETCDSKPCQHDSACTMETATSFKCNCTDTGFAGERCENLIDYTECRQQTCFGNMTCDQNKCDCNSIDCEKIFLQMKSRPREIVYHLVIWPLLVIMVSLLIILFSIFAMRIKKSRATRGTYSPSRHEQQASRIEFNMDLKIPPEERLI